MNEKTIYIPSSEGEIGIVLGGGLDEDLKNKINETYTSVVGGLNVDTSSLDNSVINLQNKIDLIPVDVGGTDWSKYSPISHTGPTSIVNGQTIDLLDITGEGYINLLILTGGRMSFTGYPLVHTIIIDGITYTIDKSTSGLCTIICSSDFVSYDAEYYRLPKIGNDNGTYQGRLIGQNTIHLGSTNIATSLSTFSSDNIVGTDRILITKNGLHFKNNLKVSVTNNSGTTVSFESLFIGGVK